MTVNQRTERQNNRALTNEDDSSGLGFPLDNERGDAILDGMIFRLEKYIFNGTPPGIRALRPHLVQWSIASVLLGLPFWACHHNPPSSGWNDRPVDIESTHFVRKTPIHDKTWTAPDSGPLAEPCIHVWPLDELSVTSPYGHRIHPVVHRVLFHRGIDLAARRGTPVLSTAQGIVEFTGKLPLTGNTVIVAHPDGTQSLYAHLDGILVFPGQVVARRAPVGLVGSTGRSTGPHLHYQLNKGGTSTDPTLYLERVLP